MYSGETIVILDYGSQYTQLIARRIRELNVYTEIFPWDVSPERLEALEISGFILSGGPNSVYDVQAPKLPEFVLTSDAPVLGICYGMHLLAHFLGGEVSLGTTHEYGSAELDVLATDEGGLFAGLSSPLAVWMSHGDFVKTLPGGFIALAQSHNGILAAMGDPGRKIYGLQFHPEVAHTLQGQEILHHFLFDICNCQGNWRPAIFIDQAVAQIRSQVGAQGVVCGLSGGVDSAVTAALVHRAIGDQLTCIFVDTGLLRQDEGAQVEATFHQALGVRLISVDASEQFMSALAGVTDPEAKRRIIGEQFIRVFEEQAAALSGINFLAQGTIYPDVIESAGSSTSHRIKSHHNVGGLPEQMSLDLVEPLRDLFKDEVRAVGEALGLPSELVWRHPFPGPGLAVRILGDITPERVATLQAADVIFLDELRQAGLYNQVAQAFAVLLPVRTVGVMGDARTYAEVIVLRAVTTDDFMTADWAHLPYAVLARASNRIVNTVPGVNRVAYDISSKPPATIEWE
ncbi:MAG: glutamine-hydrolyzing GMP synthase [Anaerolineae bacterium]|nr:glutamine-hydrolyzing GMP synthase [Anaerolineae bacterium]